MNGPRASSSRFPYVALRVTLGGRTEHLDALLDTGFDGDVIVPAHFVGGDTETVDRIPGRLADGSTVWIAAYEGTAQIEPLPAMPVLVLALGDIPIVGTNLIRHFTVILDHGERVIVQP